MSENIVRGLIIKGSAYHVQMTRALLMAHAPAWDSPTKPILYHISGILNLRDREILRFLMPFSRRKSFFVHWIGSDVLIWRDRLNQARSATLPVRLKTLLRRLVYKRVVNLACAPWLAEELRALGIRATCAPLLVDLEFRGPAPLPSQPAFLVYLPEGREEFYGWPAVAAAAEACPETLWKVVRHSGRGMQAPSNVTFMGTLDAKDMASLYDQVTGVVRPIQHDGVSFTVMEALAAGRYVIWSHEFPGCFHLRRGDDLAALVRKVSRFTEVNWDGYWYARDNLAPQQRIVSLFRQFGLAVGH